MALEAMASNEPPPFLVYDTITATPNPSSTLSLLFDNAASGFSPAAPETTNTPADPARRKRRRRVRSCKNKEEAESQRMTHIAVERNRRRLMNEHLAVLRFLMPESYIQRGDQASIVGGAIDFVKELEQLLQSLEAQKRTLQLQQQMGIEPADSAGGSCSNAGSPDQPPFAQFFAYPQYIWCHTPREYPPTAEPPAAVADIEVTLVETHANLRVLTRRRPRQLLKMVAGLQALRLTILHLNVTTLDSMVLYTISSKAEEGCNLTTVDDIAAAVHHILILIEAESAAASSQ